MKIFEFTSSKILIKIVVNFSIFDFKALNLELDFGTNLQCYRTLLFLFSTSVELESDNVCMYVCLSGNFGAAWRLQKWFDLAEILHTCSLGKYLGVFFSFFKNFHFRGFGTSF